MASVHPPERLNTQPADRRFVRTSDRNASPMAAWSFSVDSRQPAQEWRDTMNQLGLPVEDLSNADSTNASVLCLTSPLGVEFAVVEAGGQSISGRRADQPHTAWMAVLLDGRASLITGQRMDRMSPGDIAYGPIGQAAAIKLDMPCRLMFVRAPHRVIDTQAGAPFDPRVIHLPTATGSGRILSGLLRATANALAGLTVDQLRPVELALIEFLTLWPGEREGEENASCAPLRRLRQTIEVLMPDPDLSLRRVADEEGVTPRYVQKLLGANDETFSGYLRARRLERCLVDLTSPQHAALSIYDIHARWGFKGSAQFSRAFRERFGASPRQVRRQVRPEAR
jgi:AraC-like DNA-binding protein